MIQSKHPLQSMGIVAPVITVFVYFANLFFPGLGVTDADAAPIIGAIDILLGCLFAIIGRWKAKTLISLKKQRA